MYRTTTPSHCTGCYHCATTGDEPHERRRRKRGHATCTTGRAEAVIAPDPGAIKRTYSGGGAVPAALAGTPSGW